MASKENNYSYSKIDMYDTCGYKFKLYYIDKYNAFNNTIATEFGSAVHKAEEDIANAIMAGQPINYTLLKNRLIIKLAELERRYPKDYAELDKSDRTYKQKLFEYLESGIYRLENFMKAHPSYEIVGAEKHFHFDYNSEYSFNGYIDRIIHDKETDTYIVQDIKTWAVPVEDEKLVTPLQFVFYTLAMMQLYNCSEEQISCQYDLPLCDMVQDAGTKGYMTRGKKKIEKLLADIKAGDFAPSPSPLCHWCNYCPTNANQSPEYKNKPLCPYYMKWTKENKSKLKLHDWEGPENHERIMEEYRNEMRMAIKGGDN